MKKRLVLEKIWDRPTLTGSGGPLSDVAGCARNCGDTRVWRNEMSLAAEMAICSLQPTRLPLQVRVARESVCRVTLDSIAGLMQSRHRQERENVKAFTFGVENDHVSGFGWKRDKIPVRHPIFIPVRHLQYEWAITFDCFFYLSACHNKRSSQAFTFASTLRRKIEDG